MKMDKLNRELVFTRYTNTTQGTYLAKQYALVNHQIQKQAAAQMKQGTAEYVACDFDAFYNLLKEADSNTAMGYGVYDVGQYGTSAQIVVKAKANATNGSIARSKEYFGYADKPGILMIDHDPSKDGRPHTPESLLDALSSIYPAIATCAKIIKYSISSGVVMNGQTPPSSVGFHLYIPVLSASDIPRFGKLLYDHLWLKGEGFISLSTCGTMLERAAIDAAVFSPERLDFVGRPVIVSDQLAYTPRPEQYAPGDYLDTQQLADLTSHEIAMLDILKTAAKHQKQAHAEIAKQQWRTSLINQRVADGADKIKMTALIDELLANEMKSLYGDYPLLFDAPHLGGTTAAQVLRQPNRYDQQTLADPISGLAGGANKAIFYWNNGNKPIIHSFAQGGRVFALSQGKLKTNRQGRYENTLPNLAIGFSELLDGQVYYDTFEDVIFIKCRNTPWTELSAELITHLRLLLVEENFVQPTNADISDLMRYLAKTNERDSAIETVNQLQWDGVARIDTFFSRYFGAEDFPYVRAVSRYTWSTIAGRILAPGCQADMMPVLIGKQGIGKTQGIKAMALKPEHWCEITLEEHDNDNARITRGKVLAEVSELRGLNSRDAESIKAYISRQVESWVPKYQEYATAYKRRFIFIGTTNENRFLCDTTGNRRFLPINVTQIDVQAIKRDVEQLYAEACVIFNDAGIQWQDAQHLANAELDAFFTEDVWETTIMDALSRVNTQQDAVTTAYILSDILDIDVKSQTSAHTRRVSNILRKNGWEMVQKRRKGVRCYVWQFNANC